MSWSLVDITNSTTYPIYGDAKVSNTLHELDSAQLSTSGTGLAVDDHVKIVDNGSSTVIFIGYIKTIQVQDNTKIIQLTLIETANELKDTIAMSGGSDSFVYSSQTIATIIGNLLTGTGWTVGSTDTTVVPVVAFTHSTVLDGINQLLYNMYGYEIWYTDNGSGTKTIYWGTQRSNKSSSNIVYNRKVNVQDSNFRNMTNLTVYGTNDTFVGYAWVTGSVGAYTVTTSTSAMGTSTKSPVKSILYRDTTAQSATACAATAGNLLSDYMNPRQRYELHLLPNYTYNICDLIKVDGTTFIIRDITYTMSETVIGVGSYYLSYADMYGTTIQQISGTTSTGSSQTWTPGTQNIGSNSSGANTVSFPIQINNWQAVQNFVLTMNIGKFTNSAVPSSGSINTGYSFRCPYC